MTPKQLLSWLVKPIHARMKGQITHSSKKCFPQNNQCLHSTSRLSPRCLSLHSFSLISPMNSFWFSCTGQRLISLEVVFEKFTCAYLRRIIWLLNHSMKHNRYGANETFHTEYGSSMDVRDTLKGFLGIYCGALQGFFLLLEMESHVPAIGVIVSRPSTEYRD